MTSEVGTRLSISDPGSGTATSTALGTTASPYFIFTSVPASMDVCSSAMIQWQYAAPASCNISLLASSTIVPNPGEAGPPIMGATIALNIDATLESFDWSPVNLTAGRYVLQATGPGIAYESSPFIILNGPDTSCLSGTPAPLPSSSGSSSVVPTATTSMIVTSSSVGALPTSSPTSLPVTGAVSSHARVGAIVGGIIGGVAIVGAAVAGYIFFGLCRRNPTRSRRRAMDGSGRPGNLGRWGGLSSRDSGMDEGLPVSTAPTSGKPPLVLGIPNRRETTESTGAILSPSSTAHGHSNSRGVSSEDVSTLGDEEKAVFGGGTFYSNVPSLASTRQRSSLSTPGATPPISPFGEPPSSYGRSRAKSSSQSHRALALAKLDGENSSSPPSSVPPTPRTRSPTVPRRSVDSMQLRTFDAPPMPMQVNTTVAAAAGMNRTSSGNTPRRATRKPVPTLDEADMMPPPSATSMTTPSLSSTASASVSRGPSTSSSTVGNWTPAPSPHPMYKSDSGSGSTLRAPLAQGRQHSREDLVAAGMELPNLNHKSSFGDKQVHYIIPDMPPPPRE
ncbi:hypothetical protein C8Q77DRAFT_1053949 [Trametes polyzona]|nr:hypothetical protein C8Q77DRAFT_1053949 [Trametes polyzona]